MDGLLGSLRDQFLYHLRNEIGLVRIGQSKDMLEAIVHYAEVECRNCQAEGRLDVLQEVFGWVVRGTVPSQWQVSMA